MTAFGTSFGSLWNTFPAAGTPTTVSRSTGYSGLPNILSVVVRVKQRWPPATQDLSLPAHV